KPVGMRVPKKDSSKGFGDLSPEHYLRVILHRKWWVLAVFLLVSAGTYMYARRLPNVYSSETLILVDPQKVPDSYVKATVTGDVRNRLSTLEQQILSVDGLQEIIDGMKLYSEERKTMTREEIVARMRKDITISLVVDFGGPSG